MFSLKRFIKFDLKRSFYSFKKQYYEAFDKVEKKISNG